MTATTTPDLRPAWADCTPDGTWRNRYRGHRVNGRFARMVHISDVKVWYIDNRPGCRISHCTYTCPAITGGWDRDAEDGTVVTGWICASCVDVDRRSMHSPQDLEDMALACGSATCQACRRDLPATKFPTAIIDGEKFRDDRMCRKCRDAGWTAVGPTTIEVGPMWHVRPSVAYGADVPMATPPPVGFVPRSDRPRPVYGPRPRRALGTRPTLPPDVRHGPGCYVVPGTTHGRRERILGPAERNPRNVPRTPCARRGPMARWVHDQPHHHQPLPVHRFGRCPLPPRGRGGRH